MKRKSLTVNVFILFSLLYILQVKAQVTIGAGLEPRKGLLLDLKESNASNKESNSSKGFGLPRITLTSPTTLTIDDDSKKNDYVGVMVYNIGSSPVEGVYSWDGTQWVSLTDQGTGASQGWNITGNSGTSATTNFLGTTDSVALAIRVNNKLAGYISPTPHSNLSFGYNANQQNGGSINLAIGRMALSRNASGYGNIAIGEQTLEYSTTGSTNVAIGYSNLGKNTTGNDNIAIGHGALIQNTTGANNIAIGYNAGNNVITGGNNIFIGVQTTLSGGSNQMNIGNLIFGNNMTGNINNPAGNIGIRVANPQQPLHVEGAARITGSDGTPVKLMGRDANGDIGNVETGDGLQLSGGILNTSMNETTGSETKKIQYYGAYQPEKTIINGFFEFRTVHAGSNQMGYEIRLTVNPGGNTVVYCAYGAAWGGIGTNNTLQAYNKILTFTTGNWSIWQQISAVEQSLNGHNVMVSVDTQSATNLGSSPIFYNLIVQRIGENDGTGLKTLVVNRY